jgi:D-glycero-alpha-D-manno-heptose-7-phosphate kinase
MSGIQHNRRPLRIINSVAPIRIVDNGGWTDTWFAEYGKIFNIGVYPYAEVQIEVYPYDGGPERIVIQAENYGDRYEVHTDKARWNKHPLLEAAIHHMRIPEDIAFQVTIYSEAPAGASTGTSAAVSVALIGGLDRLTPGRMTQHEVAYAAHHVEMNILSLQCGIQDQICSAFGGINFIEMQRFPYATVSQIQVPNSTWWELERRLTLIYFGQSHDSSEVHKKVIRELENAGPECTTIDDLRHTAERSRDALFANDFDAFGRAMIDNTDAQGRLHSELISPEAQRVIDVARAHGAIGWKVNGAGGYGGSLTILGGPLSHAKRRMIREIELENTLNKNIPVYLSRHGLRTWEQSHEEKR